MANYPQFTQRVFTDEISVLDGGMDSNINPLLLPKNQVSFAVNATVRGGFLTDRPPYTNKLNVIWPSDEVRAAFESGLFQGGAYYQPDSGNQSIFGAVSGRLYQFVVNGDDLTAYDRTPTADANPATATQAWLWQAENYLIWNDGLSLPIFWDGATSRRSYGPSVDLADATAALPLTVPPVGSPVTLTLVAPYTGPYNVPVLFHSQYYQPIENAAGYDVALTNYTDVPGTVYPAGTAIVIRNDVFGVSDTTLGGATGGTYPTNGFHLSLTLTLPWTGTLFYDGVILYGKVWVAIHATGNVVQLQNLETVTLPVGNYVTAGQVLLKSSATAPNVIIGNIADSTTFTAPIVGAGNTATLSQLYSGSANQAVFIGDAQYTATAVPSGPGTTTLILINLTDSEGVAYPTPLNLPIYSVPELPAGRMGVYGLTQNWISLVDGLQYIVSDASRGPSGTAANNYRDAVLKTADLTFRGGSFAIPGAGNVITSLTFTTNLDLALGQGSLMVGTSAFMASNIAPFDFTNPPTTGPILTYSLIGLGPLAQDSTFSVNSDIYFRSQYGTGSLILSRRSFDVPGNLPDSAEMERVVVLDNESLLSYGCGSFFDNRQLMTVSPQASSQGVFNAGLIVKNYDTLSSLRGKAPPCWDGLWTGLNILKLIKDSTGNAPTFSGTKRQFAFTYNVSLSKIEIYEIDRTGTDHFDNETIPIVWGFETGSLFNKDIKDSQQRIRLMDGEFAVDDVIGQVRFDVYYKPDQGCWTPWNSFSICAADDSLPQYFPRLGLGEPTSTDCETASGTPSRDAFTYQIKYFITGHCRFLKLKLTAVTVPDLPLLPPTCDTYIEQEIT